MDIDNEAIVKVSDDIWESGLSNGIILNIKLEATQMDLRESASLFVSWLVSIHISPSILVAEVEC